MKNLMKGASIVTVARMIRAGVVMWLFSASATLVSCLHERSALPAGVPDHERLDTPRLASVAAHIRTDPRLAGIDSLLVLRHGRLVTEEYFNGYKRESLHTIQSVTKSFTSALIGIAIQEGTLALDQRVLSSFPGISTPDPRKAALAIRHILTMRTGVDYSEGYAGSPHDQLNRLSRGWDLYYLGRPMAANPGEVFQYDSGGVILLSAILKNTIGMHADVYAEKRLFPQLGIRVHRWVRNAEGHPHTGGGLFLRPMDMAKLGLLYLQGGVWDGVQVVPKEWVRESTRQQVSFDRPGSEAGYETGYGYLWWILKPDGRDPLHRPIYAAYGFMGQYVFVVPAYDMVVVFTGSARNGEAMNLPKVLFFEEILPCVLDADAA